MYMWILIGVAVVAVVAALVMKSKKSS